MNKLILFDIDGTLVKASTAHYAAFSEAFKAVYGVETTIGAVNSYGMTDQQIIIEVLKKNGLDEQTIKSKLEECMKVMIDSFNRLIGDDKVAATGGTKELLEELNSRDILVGLVTGNLEPIARGKLKKIGLDHYFKVGGFGSDDINRANLVNLAIKEAEEKFNFKFENNVFLFGDTPQDIEAGQRANVKTVGVATGIYSKEELARAGADFVLEDLKNINKVLKIIL